MKPTPKGWPRVSVSLAYADAPAAIEWLCRVLGFEAQLVVPGAPGTVVHSQLTFGPDGLIMISTEKDDRPYRSPKSLGGKSTASTMLFVDDVDAHHARVAATGATITDPPATHDYGPEYWTDRSYGVADPEGHQWWLTQRIRG